jgi:UDPglucose 6-dehydrogenase
MKVAIVGTGYVGLVSGVCLAAKGHDIRCVDTNPSIVKQLNAGKPTIHERGLPVLLTEVLASGRFKAYLDLDSALEGCDLVIIAVGTPSTNGIIDLKFVSAVSREIGRYIGKHNRYISVVVKSTVIPGTTDSVVKDEIESASGKKFGEFGLGMNPEFLREGEAIADFADPDRIVLGYEDEKTLHRLEELYAPWSVDKVPVNTRTAELIKYASNALLATQISAINEIANLASALGGVDIMDVVKGVHLDKRWNPIIDGRRVKPQILSYLVPGCGFGGSCFPKDVQALRSEGARRGLPMLMLNAVLDVNKAQSRQVTDMIRREVGDLAGRLVLVLGLAFKPGTDDVRETASLRIIESLLENGARVKAHDPIAADHFAAAFPAVSKKISFVENWEQEVETAEIIVVATSWPEYLPVTNMKLAGKLFFDARRMFDPTDAGGARYLAIGRG